MHTWQVGKDDASLEYLGTQIDPADDINQTARKEMMTVSTYRTIFVRGHRPSFMNPPICSWHSSAVCAVDDHLPFLAPSGQSIRRARHRSRSRVESKASFVARLENSAVFSTLSPKIPLRIATATAQSRSILRYSSTPTSLISTSENCRQVYSSS